MNQQGMKNDNALTNVLAWLNHPLARLLSFIFAIGLSVFILLFPQHIARDLTELDHGILSLVMLAMCGCFVHGIGFQPYNIVAKILFSPVLCWPVAGLAVWMWVL
ncbi:cyd operon YbgE family protein [Pseudomonas sp. HK3]